MNVTNELAAGTGLRWALNTASQVKHDWQSGVSPNLVHVLETYPGLSKHRTIVIELAYEEFSLRRKKGEAPDPGEFSRRFRSFARSIEFYLAVRTIVDANSDCTALRNDVDWPEAGDRFIGFELLCEIGRGAAGRVYLATEDELGGRRVALKVTLEGGHEANILGKFQHQNIVPIFSVKADETSGLSACCMPYLGQATLASVVDCVYADHRIPKHASSILTAIANVNEDAEVPESRLPPNRIFITGPYVEGVMLVGAQLAEALAHAHSKGIVHRDLKPSNILMAPDGQPLLLDFNLSVDSSSPIWRIGGTLPYMAPEELLAVFKPQSFARHCDPRSDVFSLGVILYELLAGALPFDTIKQKPGIKKIAADLRKRQRKGPGPLRRHNRQVDKRLARLIESCLAFDPELRPATADVLAIALRKELSLPRRASRWSAAHRGFVVATIVIAMLIAAGATSYLLLRPPYPVRQLRQGLAYFEVGQDELALRSLNASLDAEPHCSDALVARARVRQHRDEFQLAFADYDAADKLAPSPQIAACKGYCLNRLGQEKAAVVFYRRTITEGYDSPAVLNNLGFSLLQLGKLEEAKEYLEKAAKVDDEQAPHLNLVVVFVRQALSGQAIPPAAFLNARRAQEIGTASGELYRDLAWFYALAAKQDAGWKKSAIDCVAGAVAHGIDPPSLTSDPIFSEIATTSPFEEALVRRSTAQGAVKAIRVLDPSSAEREARRISLEAIHELASRSESFHYASARSCRTCRG